MSDTSNVDQFLASVEELRGDDDAVRSTAHTSSVSADGWATDDADPSTEN